MGAIIKLSINNINTIKNCKIPVILYKISTTYKNELIDKNINNIKLNKKFAQKLIFYNQKEREIKAYDIVKSMLLESNMDILLSDFDILFDPRYYIDVIKLFIEVSRVRKIYVEWPGNLVNKILTYSEPKYSDYSEYIVENYDIYCIT